MLLKTTASHIKRISLSRNLFSETLSQNMAISVVPLADLKYIYILKTYCAIYHVSFIRNATERSEVYAFIITAKKCIFRSTFIFHSQTFEIEIPCTISALGKLLLPNINTFLLV